MSVIFQLNLDNLSTHDLGHIGVDGKGRICHHHLIAFINKGIGDHEDKIVSPI